MPRHRMQVVVMKCDEGVHHRLWPYVPSANMGRKTCTPASNR